MDPPPPSLLTAPLGVSVEENPSSHATVLGDPSSSVWDWSDFLDFSIDEQLNFSLDSDHPLPEPNLSPIAPNSDLSNEVGGGPSEDPVNKISASVMVDNRVRKRDPRLVCSNFLAGRIPCECPELDEKMEEEEGLPGKKRARTLRATAATLRCQVPECEADISKLKGYHRRHRVCLQCANASNVMLDGKRKRYCQQCGKFHILLDFDEGKRSCRRKLERHNNRRRRKASESCIAVEREPHRLDFPDDIACDDKIGKDSISLGSQIAEQGLFSEYGEGQISTHCSNPDSQIVIQNDSVVSFVASGEVQIDGERDDSKHAHSSPCDNKSTYSSTCPTGRISFKLYDWNPAEFPRRLRHQIFQWLASMPVELEGYIRPGCTILTVFISMPNFMWLKLHEDPTAHIRDLIAASGMMLYGRDPILVYVENMIFRLKRDATSVVPVKVQEQAPKLHYVHPRCFEAGKPMEFVACGSNMLQPKFRFLVSFAGKYLAYGSCVPPRCDDTEQVTANSAHQLLRIQIPHTDPDLFGPAFVEVENESGISNFIPILIGDEEICSEMKIMEHRFESSLNAEISILMATGSSDSSNVSVMRQTAFSQFILDTAWLLRKSALEDIKHDLSSTQINRFNRLLTFLLENKSTTILERVLHYMECVMNNLKFNNVDDVDFSILQRNMNQARKIICEKVQKKLDSVQISCNSVQERGFVCRHSQIKMMSASFLNQDMGTTERGTMGSLSELNSEDYSGYIPLLNREVTKSNLPLLTKVSRKSCSPMFKNKYLASRPLIFTIAVSAVCFGICVVAFHPENAGKITTTIRSCLFDDTS